MTGYGEVVRETAAERYERKVAAIEAVLVHWFTARYMPQEDLHKLAEQCLDAAEAGF